MRAPLPVLGNRSQHRVLLLLLASVYPFVKVLADLGDSGHRTLAEAGIQSQGSVARETEAGCVALFALGIGAPYSIPKSGWRASLHFTDEEMEAQRPSVVPGCISLSPVPILISLGSFLS